MLKREKKVVVMFRENSLNNTVQADPTSTQIKTELEVNQMVIKVNVI